MLDIASSIQVDQFNVDNQNEWNGYVKRHQQGTVFQMCNWLSVFENAYNLKSTCLIARDKNHYIKGILGLTQTRHFLFGHNMTSLPFMDYSGLLADDLHTEQSLIKASLQLTNQLGAQSTEIRQAVPLKSKTNELDIPVRQLLHKVRLVKKLNLSAEEQLKAFKTKLRSQIKRPIKAGLYCTIGGKELIDDFYKVFAVNMRDIGSPVHSKLFFTQIILQFEEHARIFVVYDNMIPVACSLLLHDNNLAENPWASSLRSASRKSPNMLLYWSMLEYCCQQKISFFSFGRSSPDSGTFRFKQQWGVETQPLYWYRLNENSVSEDISSGGLMTIAGKVWIKMPLFMANFIGPKLRKHIPL